MNRLKISFKKFSKLCYVILGKLQADGGVYDAIICPLRGGFYLSYFLSRHLDLPVKYVEIKSYRDKEIGNIEIGLRHKIEGDTFLLCDDIYDSGNTIRIVRSLYPEVKIDTACLISKDKNADVYFGLCLERNVWVDFFWEVM